MKKQAVIATSLSLIFSLAGIILVYLGLFNPSTLVFSEIVANFKVVFDDVIALISGKYFLLIPAGILILVSLIGLIVKLVQRRPNVIVVFVASLLASTAYLITAPKIEANFFADPNNPLLFLDNITYAVGTLLIILMVLVLILLNLIAIFSVPTVKVDKLYEDVIEEPIVVVEKEVDTIKEEEPVVKEKAKPVPKKVKEEKVVVKEQPVVVKEEKVSPPPPKKSEPSKPLPVKKDELEKPEPSKKDPVKPKMSKKSPVKVEPDKPEARKKDPVKQEGEDFDRIYHIRKRASDNLWIVKLANRSKAIKTFYTKAEAMKYAEELAQKNNGVARAFASKGADKGKITS